MGGIGSDGGKVRLTELFQEVKKTHRVFLKFFLQEEEFCDGDRNVLRTIPPEDLVAQATEEDMVS